MKLQEFRKLIREEVRKALNEETFYDKLKKMNPGWSKESALADFADDYEKQEDWDDTGVDVSGDYEDHQKYLKDSEAYLNTLTKKSPSVKVGDLVNVYAKSMKRQCIGKIVKEAVMKGSYGFLGNVMPNKVPAWVIDCYTDKPGYEEQKKQLIVKGKTYKFAGTVQYPQYSEGEAETFTKLK